jgi:allantoicase
LEVGVDGTIDEIGATDNATGYASAALAVAGLPAVQTDHARLGYATVIHTGADFVGGTTEWTASGVTAVYVDLLPTAKLSSDLISRGK